MRRVVIVPGSDPGRAAELVSALLRAGIEVRRASASFSSARAHAYADDARLHASLRRGRVRRRSRAAAGQGRARDPRADVRARSGLRRAQIEKFERNHRRGKRAESEGYEFYDVTAWSLPVAFGVESYWTDDATAIAGDLLSLPAEEPALPQARQQPRRVGGELLSVDVGGGIVAGRGATSAYLFGPERNGAPRLLVPSAREGFRVSVSSESIDAGGRHWPRGTYVAHVARNDSTLGARIDALARESGVEVVGVNSAQAGVGQYGIGSESMVSIPTPEHRDRRRRGSVADVVRRDLVHASSVATAFASRRSP